jgi:5S rRNA maturation endonuclease (ribonuclease M5)
MSHRNKGELSDELKAWVEQLNSLGGDALIVVEGKKDEKALKNIGVALPTVHINKGMSILGFLESILRRSSPLEGLPKVTRIVILTDWDRTGERLSLKLSEGCGLVGLEADLEPRRRLISIAGRFVKTVESLDSLMFK